MYSGRLVVARSFIRQWQCSTALQSCSANVLFILGTRYLYLGCTKAAYGLVRVSYAVSVLVNRLEKTRTHALENVGVVWCVCDHKLCFVGSKMPVCLWTPTPQRKLASLNLLTDTLWIVDNQIRNLTGPPKPCEQAAKLTLPP